MTYPGGRLPHRDEAEKDRPGYDVGSLETIVMQPYDAGRNGVCISDPSTSHVG